MLAFLPADPRDARPEERGLFGTRGTLRMITDDLDGARGDLSISIPSADLGMGPQQLTALGILVDLEYRAGDWDSSAVLAERLVGLVEDTGQTWMLAFAHAVAVLVPAGRGQWDLAEEHLHAAEEASAVIANQASRAYTDNAAVHLAYCRGDADGVVSAAKDLLVDRGGPHEPGVVGWPPQYASALVDLRRLKDADEAAKRDGRTGPRTTTPLTPSCSCARSRRTRGNRAPHVRGASRLHRRAALGAGQGDALETAVAHAAYGRFLRRRGERRSAVSRLAPCGGDVQAAGCGPVSCSVARQS